MEALTAWEASPYDLKSVSKSAVREPTLPIEGPLRGALV